MGNRNSVRTEETNLGNLSVDANLDAARRFDPTVVVSVKNGGGIRAPIGVTAGGVTLPPPGNPLVGKAAGQISQIDIENALRFNNELSLLTLTAAQLLEIIEHAVAESDPGSRPGKFAQVAGLAFSFDISQPAGSRVRSLVLTDANGNPTDIIAQNGETVGDMNRFFRIVTLNFLAGGGDDYPYPNFPNTEREDLSAAMTEEQSGGQATFAAPGTEQDALAEYLAANFSETPFTATDVGPESDERIQNLAFRTDSLIVPPSTAATFDTQLSAGLNMISLPLMPDEPYTARSFMEILMRQSLLSIIHRMAGSSDSRQIPPATVSRLRGERATLSASLNRRLLASPVARGKTRWRWSQPLRHRLRFPRCGRLFFTPGLRGSKILRLLFKTNAPESSDLSM